MKKKSRKKPKKKKEKRKIPKKIEKKQKKNGDRGMGKEFFVGPKGGGKSQVVNAGG